jgi:hypothetical protein
MSRPPSCEDEARQLKWRGVAKISPVIVKCGGCAKGRGDRWAIAGEAGESMFKEDRLGVSDLFGARFASESRRFGQ